MVRVIRTEDGGERIQVRLELGLMQMELDGRPDGQRVGNFESWLAFYAAQQEAHDQENPDGKPFQLEPDDCQKLLQEGVQFYHRYISFWQLGRYELCARDTSRNLRLFDFVRRFARRDRDKLLFDQWRPYVTMMRTRAVATPLVELEDIPAALRVIESGIEGIHQFLEDYGQEDRAADCNELVHLEQWRDELQREAPEERRQLTVDKLPESPLDRLRKQLEQAVTEERYEDAAALRDQIAQLRDSSSHQ
ncbi:MAG: hypothetical protein DWQ31_19310 [Planctomycetota bacterium]|nr:MAG: hypothetical protein DWQ31_19310 [Planctomycetota bacterium]REJ87630.1 MAG: hypothetical protein DWQ35_21155 [Planctomycetota bacterium]REK30287.1 MAG: hypothetical protein DWQ42_01985 [Planctomycetota bacterium]REK43335.1 MAG: hypothetical protein DWQ46_11810 [Planctomycetota bacterium]